MQGGQPVADVVDRWGGVYRAVRFLGLGGGIGNFGSAGARGVEAGDKSELATDGDAAEVALVFPETTKAGRAQKPWIIASAMHPSDGAKVTLETEAPATGSDYTKHHATDHVIGRKTARVVVSELAGVAVQGLAGQPVRVQLAGSDKLRVSSDGEANETVLLGGRLRAFLDALVARLELQRLAIVTLENWANTAVTPSTGEPTASFVQDYNAWVAANAAGGIYLAPDEPFVATADTIESAVVAISSKSKGG